MKIWRQGDVAITPTNKNSKFDMIKKDMVLAEGEVTGHAHRITKGDAKLWFEKTMSKAMQDIKEMDLECYTETEVTHEEHEGIVLPIGNNRVVIQREWDWASKMTRKVID